MITNRLFYYTGSGNSLWVAKEMAIRLAETEIVSIMSGGDALEKKPAKRTGIIFPVYVWGVPAPVLDFIKKMADIENGYLFAIATNAGQVANTLVQLSKECLRDGLHLSSGFSIKMPSSYIPWGGSGSPQKCRNLYDDAQKKLDVISRPILDGAIQDVEKGPLWERVIFSYIYKKSLPYLPIADEKFWVDGRCDSCGVCFRVCPAENIQMIDGKPSWLHHCHQCFACLHWCPQEALQWGKRTPRFTRHRPADLSLKDILKR